MPLTAHARYAATATGAGLAGAALSFLLVSQGESVKQDTRVLDMLASQADQIELVLQNQAEIRGKMAGHAEQIRGWEKRLESLVQRQRQFERTLRDLDLGQIRLRDELASDLREKVRWAMPSESAAKGISDLMRALVELEREGDSGVWTLRGAPYADTDVLSRRLNRRVTADERDQAAALLEMTRQIGIDNGQ